MTSLRATRPAQAAVASSTRLALKPCESGTEDEHVTTGPSLLTPAEVARLFAVDPKTVTRWASSGRIQSVLTPGGHRRFHREEIERLLRPAR
jgi:excisionase family DNA binding protein